MLAGTCPPWRSTSFWQQAWMLFALFRKKPVVRMAASNSGSGAAA
jgi:hypothetical protein